MPRLTPLVGAVVGPPLRIPLGTVLGGSEPTGLAAVGGPRCGADRVPAGKLVGPADLAAIPAGTIVSARVPAVRLVPRVVGSHLIECGLKWRHHLANPLLRALHGQAELPGRDEYPPARDRDEAERGEAQCDVDHDPDHADEAIPPRPDERGRAT